MIKWINEKYRLVVVNDETFQEERSFRLKPTTIYVLISTVLLTIVLLTVTVLSITPLGNLIPHRVGGSTIRSELNTIYLHIDSLEREVVARDVFIEKVKGLVFEEFNYADDIDKNEASTLKNTSKIPDKNSELRALMESVEHESKLGNLMESTVGGTQDLKTMIFLCPLKGLISDTFSIRKNHFGTDIVAPKGSVIRATQKGTVIVATWSAETGHMLGIQHDNNVISFYKHNSSLLKKSGDRVGPGEGVAIIGNSGEQTDGPHLHFELWFSGQPVDPQQYIRFQ